MRRETAFIVLYECYSNKDVEQLYMSNRDGNEVQFDFPLCYCDVENMTLHQKCNTVREIENGKPTKYIMVRYN